MRGSIFSILGLFILVSGSGASLSSFNRPINFFKEDPPALVNRNERPEEKIINIDDELFSNMESTLDLETLLSKLGITDVFDDVPIYQPPQFSRSETLSTRNKDVDQIFRSTKQKKYLKNPEQAHCNPELKTVSLGLEKLESSVQYYPTCIKINQCGGCCPKKDILECRPIVTEKVIVKVLELRKQNSRSPRPRRRRRVRATYKALNVSVEEHTECACMCKSTADECDLRIHKFDSSTCLCKCTNIDEQNKCIVKDSHAWDSKTCKCVCRNQLTCSTGQIFNKNSCTCQETNRRTQSNSEDKFLKISSNRDDLPFIKSRKPIMVHLQ